jgi:hypothetical protein
VNKLAKRAGLAWVAYLVLGYAWLYYKTWYRDNPGLVIDPSRTIGIRDTRRVR